MLKTETRKTQRFAMVEELYRSKMTRKEFCRQKGMSINCFSRLKEVIEAGVPVTNYGMAIAWTKGIFARAIEPFVHV